MTIYDLSKELFSASVFSGDPIPQAEAVLDMGKGDVCNLTRLTLGVHNGTHLDAPRHFCPDGPGADEIDLNKCVGKCRLVELSGTIGTKEIADALDGGTERLLIKGDILLTPKAAQTMTESGLLFLGVEHMTVGDPKDQASMTAVHRELLSHEVVVLESAVMTEVPEGEYFLVCQPLKMKGLDGSPARPLLISLF